MGRPPHAGCFSMSLSTSRKAVLLLLQQRHSVTLALGSSWAGGACVGWAGSTEHHSRQLLQSALLVDLVGAVGHVREEVILSMVLQDVADVLHTHLCLVPLLQGLKEPVALEWGVVGEVKAWFRRMCTHTSTDT